MSTNAENLMTPKEVAAFLGVARSTIGKWISNNELPFIVIQQRQRKAVIRFRRKVLEDWLHQREIATN